MNDESPEATWSYRAWELDRFHIEVRLVEDALGKNVREVWRAELVDAPPSAEIPFDLIGELVDALRMEDGLLAPHVVSHRQSYFSWGSDGAAAQVVLEVAADYILPGLATGALYDALKHVVRRLVAQGQARSNEPRKPLSQSEAIQQARSHLVEAFDLGNDAGERMDVSGVTKLGRGESWVVQFVLDGRRFEAELVDEYGLVRVGRLGWSASGSDSD